jgi:hypothetical protein
MCMTLAKYLSERKMFRTIVVEENETHISCSINFHRKSYGSPDN